MSVWLTIPSARPANEAQACVDKWKAMGYKVALHRDGKEDIYKIFCDFMSLGEYRGYARTTNELIRAVLALDPECSFVVTGGDDTDPDPKKRADEIAAECSAYFEKTFFEQAYRLSKGNCDLDGLPREACKTFGVMQPTGDRFADGSIDRIAGSPWIGREFCERAYGGSGPYWHEYYHNFVDEELQHVAQKLGIFWQRPDLTHLHHHFLRKDDSIDSGTIHRPTPPHLVKAFNGTDWSRSQPMFLGRKAAGFPGHETLGVAGAV